MKLLTFSTVVFKWIWSVVNGGEVEYDNGYFVGVWDKGVSTSWEEAETYCTDSMGTKLASIQSSIENSRAIDAAIGTGANISTNSDIISTEWAWIGLHDQNNEQNWTWSDKSNFNYTNWGENQPATSTNNQRDCVLFRAYDTWADRNCDGFDQSTVWVCNRLNLPQPDGCAAYWTKDSSGNDIVTFEWGDTIFGNDFDSSDFTYRLGYYAGGSVTTIQYLELDISLNSRSVSDFDYNQGADNLAGTIQIRTTTLYDTIRESDPVDCYSFTVSPSLSPSQIPSDQPTLRPTTQPTPAPTWDQPYLYIGGDICANQRCDCNQQSLDCVGSDVYTAWRLGSIQQVTFEQRQVDFGYPTNIYWYIEYLGSTSNVSDIYSDFNLSDSEELIDPDRITEIEISPTSGWLSVETSSQGDSNFARATLDVDGPEDDIGVFLFRLTLKNCSINDTNIFDKEYINCSIIYPNQLYIIIDNTDDPEDEVINIKSKEDDTWMYWLSIPAGGIALILFFIIYRFWSKNSKTEKSLAEKRGDLELAIEEAENGWQSDMDDNQVNYNPMATGSTNTRQNGNDQYNNGNTLQSHAIKDRADVTIEKFNQRSQFGPVAPTRV